MIARDGWPLIIFTGFLTGGSFLLSPWMAVVMGVFFALVVWFFRDPERDLPEDVEMWVSPADGKVVEIEEVEHPYTGRALKVGIFMSPFNVHVNRAPYEGTVEFLEYVPGKKWMAFNPKASEENERMYVGLRTDHGPVLLVQIAGFLARRIVCRLKRGEKILRGQRFGMIKLGSKVDVYLPLSVKSTVTVGQKVKAGKSVLGVTASNEENE
ncbi:MAG: phosphatidylserine decarboxylase family protein [Aminobacterium sp.]|jgi:phosphatidylserine decarboxylase|uniref:phosphatidylserine decarboxylase family protein n=1 Tax=unclassified Aminobacterium TaxID=2685012 RepID=UPI001BCD08B3|nr:MULTISPECIES: phosphatidylserine decarboxylase family protein [unclassified Aminobacterium]MDD2206596.1 phosphatidylserine decarboxylase family protein [Aminobacterium sp.]MDD3425491.1 phosphatidylserine decarboxylase family protein [Aminobacterium sp.]MDD3706840.1 phosphatidylserine decarboxylase family protein [Aminobacterium sp.]MDD4228657.1 phosphatidylserine decarboxylase family protein [Aminobacterium sp.]MDD4551585.1 phosphatidylserine decarboxylase family protein [Aminobacterium sp.